MIIRISTKQNNLDTFINNIIEKYHFDDDAYPCLLNIYNRLEAVESAKAFYKINDRTTGYALIDDNPAAIVAMTLGKGVDELANHYSVHGEIDKAYMLDCIANELLLFMYKEFNNSYPKFHRRYIKRYVFFGEAIGVEEMPGYLGCVCRAEDITTNHAGVLLPSKSVLFFAILSDNPKEACEGICANCGNKDCENRTSKNNITNCIDVNFQQQYKTEIQNRVKESSVNSIALNYGYGKIFGTTKK